MDNWKATSMIVFKPTNRAPPPDRFEDVYITLELLCKACGVFNPQINF